MFTIERFKRLMEIAVLIAFMLYFPPVATFIMTVAVIRVALRVIAFINQTGSR